VRTNEYDLNSPDVVSALDDSWVWSFPFGAKILEKVVYRPDMIVLDIGCGSGFPTIDLSQRLGSDCYTVGVDVWQPALARALYKTHTWQLENIEFVHADAHQLCFDDDFFDLVISNNGINNVENPQCAMAEISRTCRSGAQLLITVNLPETFIEFYSVLFDVLDTLNKTDCRRAVQQHISDLRKSIDYTADLIETAGFSIQDIYTDMFTWRFTNSEAMFNHYMIKLAFLQGWLDCLDEDRNIIIDQVKQRMDAKAGKNRLTLSIPWICVEAKKE